MYGKLFVQMYHGSLVNNGPWEALVTFQQLIILADKEGAVDMTSGAIHRMTGIPHDIIERGLAALTQPDPDSRSPLEDGRRIVPLADNRTWGWQIVNYAHYREIRSQEDRREYHRLYGRRRREKARQNRQPDNTESTESTKAVSSKQKQKQNPPTGGVGGVRSADWNDPDVVLAKFKRDMGEE